MDINEKLRTEENFKHLFVLALPYISDEEDKHPDLADFAEMMQL